MELLGPANHTGLGPGPAGPDAGVTVGVIDTGVNQSQTQLQLPEFTSDMSTERTLSNLGSHVWSNDSPWGQCNHGTRMAGLIGAPRDGRNVVGIAWEANLTTVRTHESVVIGSDNASDIARGIRKVVNAGAWPSRRRSSRSPSAIPSSSVPSTTSKTRSARPTTAIRTCCSWGPLGHFCLFGLAFPGYLPEVTTIAGVATDRRTPSNRRCAGDAVDLSQRSSAAGTSRRPAGRPARSSGLPAAPARPRPSPGR